MARFQLVWQLALVCVVLFLAGQAQGQLPASNAAVEAAIRNPRYMRRQINCLLNESPCDNIGRTMRRKYCTLHNKILTLPYAKESCANVINCLISLCRISTCTHQGPVSWMLSTTTPTGHESNECGFSTISTGVLKDLLHLQSATVIN